MSRNEPAFVGSNVTDGLAPTSYPLGAEMLDASTWRLLYERQADRNLWLATALSAALQILHAPDVEAVLSPIQRNALKRIDDGCKEL